MKIINIIIFLYLFEILISGEQQGVQHRLIIQHVALTVITRIIIIAIIMIIIIVNKIITTIITIYSLTITSTFSGNLHFWGYKIIVYL